MTYPTRSNPHTDPSLTPQKRAHQAANAHISVDWNEETQEFNPYPLDSADFRTYENTLNGIREYAHANGYDL